MIKLALYDFVCLIYEVKKTSRKEVIFLRDFIVIGVLAKSNYQVTTSKQTEENLKIHFYGKDFVGFAEFQQNAK